MVPDVQAIPTERLQIREVGSVRLGTTVEVVVNPAEVLDVGGWSRSNARAGVISSRGRNGRAGSDEQGKKSSSEGVACSSGNRIDWHQAVECPC